MPHKRKRDSSQDKIDKYKKKIKELKKQRKAKRRRIVIQSSSESESDHTGDNQALHNPTNNRQNEATVPESEPQIPNPNLNPVETENSSKIQTPSETRDTEAAPPDATTNATPSTSEEVSLPELDPDLLSALGEESNNKPKYGEKIHQTLADRWEPILKKGLEKEVREKILKEHLVPENCTLLQAPKLNVEVAAAVSETSRSRDKRKESDQQQLGIGITAISKAMSILLTSENKIEAVKLLSEGCRILADLHYQETQSRISVINYSLAKPFLNVVQDCERDETLYGVKLSDKIKASNVIQKQGMQIKKYGKTQKTTATDKPTNTRPQYQQSSSATNQGNWSGPPRYYQNRGRGRGARGASTAPGRRPPPPATATSTAGQARPRAPPRP